MLVARLLGMLMALAIALNLAAWLFSGNRAHLVRALRLGKITLALVLLLLVLLAGERLIVL